MANYYAAAKDYIREVQAEEGVETWRDFCDLMPRLFAREAGDKGRSTEIFPSSEATREFLDWEAHLSEPTR